jgi:hypothetical protein
LNNMFQLSFDKKVALKIIAGAFLIAMMIIFSGIVFAQEKPNIQFPVAELDNCQSEEECKAYCDNLENLEKCIVFAEKNGLMTRDEAVRAKKFSDAGASGPGDCRGHRECEAYCDDISNIDECLAYAEEHGVLEGDDLEEARKVSKALKGGAKLPGGCRNKNECEIYCNDPENIDQCLAFAEKAGFLPPEELNQAKKFNEFMKRGETPGGCRGHRECEAFCNNDSNFDECSEFALKAGLIPPEQAEMMRKTGGKGPGGCRGRAECEAFCNKPANSEICFAFAKDHGIIDERQFNNAKEGGRKLSGFLNDAPPEVLGCVESKLGKDYLEGVKNGSVVPSQNIARTVEGCFREFHERDNRRRDDSDFEEHDEREDFRDNSRDSGFRPEDALRNMPREVAECVKNKIGSANDPESLRKAGEICFRELNNRVDNHDSNRDRSESGQGFDRSPHEEGQLGPDEFNDEHREEFIKEQEADLEREFQEEFKEEYRAEFDRQSDEIYREVYKEQYDSYDQSGYEQEYDSQYEDDYQRPPDGQYDGQNDGDYQPSPPPENYDQYDQNNYNEPPPENFDNNQSPPDNYNEPPPENFDGSSQPPPDSPPPDPQVQSARRFLSPSAFAPRNFGRQSASVMMFVINR